jgi:hypothetical protein
VSAIMAMREARAAARGDRIAVATQDRDNRAAALGRRRMVCAGLVDVLWRTAAHGGGSRIDRHRRRSLRSRLLRRRMAQPQSGAIAVQPLPGLRSDRPFARSALAVRHRRQRSRMAAFALLAGMAGVAQGRGSREAGNYGRPRTGHAPMIAMELQRSRHLLRPAKTQPSALGSSWRPAYAGGEGAALRYRQKRNRGAHLGRVRRCAGQDGGLGTYGVPPKDGELHAFARPENARGPGEPGPRVDPKCCRWGP